jgi:hypothetical protein
MHKLAGVVLFVILLAGLCLSIRAASAQLLEQDMEALVKISPSNYQGEVGDIIPVSVWVEDVVDLYGADIQMAFTPGELEVLDANSSLPGIQVSVRSDFLQPEILLKREADNLAGTILYAAAQLNPTEPVSGSGVLFEFQIKILQAGAHALVFSSTQLAAPGGGVIVHTSQGAVYGTLALTNLFLPLIVR